MKRTRLLHAAMVGMAMWTLAIATAATPQTAESGEVIAQPAASDQPAPPQDKADPAGQTVLPREFLSSDPNNASAATQRHRLEPTDAILILVAVSILVVFFGMGWHRLHRAPAQPVAFMPVMGLFLAMMMLVASQIGASTGKLVFQIAMPPGSGTSQLEIPALVKLTACAYGAQAVVMATYFFLRSLARPPAPDRRRSRPRAAGFGIAVVMLMWPVIGVAVNLAAWAMGRPVSEIAHETLQKIFDAYSHGGLDLWMIALMLLVTIGAPLMEEVMYRGMLQRALVEARMPRWMAIAITSAAFAMMHWGQVEPQALFGLFAFSLALGWAYEYTGRLTAPVAMHMLFNVANLAIALAITG